MHKNFSFKGTVTSNDNILAAEGECMELVNLRMANGSLRPIPSPAKVASLPHVYTAIYWHENASCYICIKRQSPRMVDFYDKNWQQLKNSDGTKVAFNGLTMVNNIEIIGNVACCLCDNGIFYLLYIDGNYRFLGDRPKLPRLNITYTSKTHKVVTEGKFTMNRSDTDISDFWPSSAKGYFDECISKCHKSGHYIDRALFRFGLRLFDGSYICCSHVIYVGDENVVEGVERDSGNLVYEQLDATQAFSAFRTMVLGFKPEFRFSALALENWKGVVTGIDLFTTGSIMGKKVGKASASLYDSETKERTSEEYELYTEKGLDELYNDISDAALYYKIAEFDIEGNCLNRIDDVSPENLALQESLAGSDIQQPLHATVAGCSYMFNNRLHVASLREYLFKGYDSFSICPAGGYRKVAEMVVVQTKINTPDGVATVLQEFEMPELGWNGTFEFPALLTYPDSRAFEMSLFIYDDTELFMKRLPLTPHKYLNQAQYLHKWSLPYKVTVTASFANSVPLPYVSDEDVLAIFKTAGVHNVIYSASMKSWTYNDAKFPPSDYANLRIFAVPNNVTDGDKIIFTIVSDTSNDNYTDIKNLPYDSSWRVMGGQNVYGEYRPYEDKPNVMKVSKVENPFVFPAKSAYSLSNGKIIAMASNTATLSEGQFGQHPLYLFSRHGIEVLSVDTSGVTAYSNVYPVSTEVCQNPKSVCGIDAGVLFHGSQGVMLISGGKCMKLSSAVDYDAKETEIIKRSPILKSISLLNNSGWLFDGVLFNDYIQGASVGRDASMNEVVFFNPYYEYCYIYSVTHGMWSKMSGIYAGTVKYADNFMLIGHNEGLTSISVSGNKFTGCNGVTLFTRPMLFGTKLPKRIKQLMLHGYMAKPDNYTKEQPFLSCYLLCSNDGVNFKIVSGRERSNESQDLLFPNFPTCSYRYFIFALSGTLKSMSMLTGLEIDLSPAWNNRLR